MKGERDLSKKEKIKNMNSKITTNSQESKTEPKRKAKQRKQKFKKNKARLRHLQDNFKGPNIQIIGVTKEKEEQEIENLFEKIMKENFENLVKEIVFQEVQEA